ncbi:MAG TPA: ABC transporter permease [Pyrinomonadaceae bacterium]|jgi:predicted permease
MKNIRLSLAAWWRDSSYGFRMLRKHPVMTVVAVLSMALGIGPNIAVFSLVNAFLLRPIPVAEPERLASLYTIDVKNPSKLRLSFLNYRDLRENLKREFSDILLHAPASLSMSDGQAPEKLLGAAVTENYFDLLGVRAGRGRTFLPEDQNSAVVILSHRFATRRFGSDAGVVGKTLTLNRRPFEVIGVAPEGFTGTDLGGGPDLWLTLPAYGQISPGITNNLNNRRLLFLNAVGRLQPGVTPQQAQSALTVISGALAQQYPDANEGRAVRLTPLLQARIDPDEKGTYSLISVVLMALVGIVLLIACINVTSLLLVRATARQKEVAIRIALGASRLRLIRQLLSESMVLALMGGLAGLGLSYALERLLWNLRPTGVLTDNLDTGLDRRVLLFTLLITLLSGVVFGLVPALYASRFDVVSMIKGGRQRRSRLGFDFGLQKALVIMQVALCLVSLIGAGLFLKSFGNALTVNTGFRGENLLMLSLDMGIEGYSEEKGRQFYKQLVEGVGALPGVRGAVLARDRPFREPYRRTVFIDGQEASGGKGVLMPANQVGLGYFETVGVPLTQGRDFSLSDDADSPRVSIVNEATARRFWPGENAVGKRIKMFGEPAPREVIGVVQNSNVYSVGEEPQPCVYLSLQQDYAPAVVLFVRTSGDPRAVLPGVQRQAQALDPNVLLFEIQTFDELLGKSLWATRAGAGLLTSLGLLALFLAAVGVFGVMSYLISRRTSEIGLRMALGAQKGDVLKLVFREGILQVIGGIVIGIGAALILTRLVTALLFGVGAFDAETFIAAPLILAAVAAVAILMPARKATKIDPRITLRAD